ncbi:MAG: murein transglycosylase A [Desulfopila sp.]
MDTTAMIAPPRHFQSLPVHLRRLRPLVLFHRMAAPVLVMLILAPVFLLSGCSSQHTDIAVAPNLPGFADDGSGATLRQALAEQQRYLNNQDAAFRVTIGPESYSRKQLAASLDLFAAILQRNPAPRKLEQLIAENFTVYQAGGRKSGNFGEMLVTGYFTPVFEGRLSRSPPFIHPIYGVPDDLITRPMPNSQADTAIAGRRDANGILRPYWTRRKIETGNLLRGHELVYLKDRFDAFLLHIQGSGHIALPNGDIRTLQYRGNNGHPYSSIGRLLVDEGTLALEHTNIPAIRRYLADNPTEVDRVLHHNKRYIFFGWAKEPAVYGSTGRPLTAGRSIAIDGDILPFGTLGYLVTRRPVVDDGGRISHWTPLQRFVLPQDSGSAIQGSGRVDLFWGAGEYAEIAAGTMKENGALYFLLPKSGNQGEQQ